MKTAVIIGLLVVVLVLLVFRVQTSWGSPISGPAPSPTVGPRNNQTYYFINSSSDQCPAGYSKPDPTNKPTICKLNSS
jgi:hypothetical protein